MPVYEDTFDNIKGVLYIKDLVPLLSEKQPFDWVKLIRNPFFVPEFKKIDDIKNKTTVINISNSDRLLIQNF